MSTTIAEIVVLIVSVYLLVGSLFAVAFVIRGAARIDPAAAKASWGFRVLIFPASCAFWPLLARRWACADNRPPTPADARSLRQRHLALWLLTAPVALAGLALATWLRTGGSAP